MPEVRNVLILGGTGRLGRTLASELEGLGASVAAPSHAEVHAERLEEVLAAGSGFPAGRPDVLVCAAAWTDVAGAERHRKAARTGNVLVPAVAARAAVHWGVPLLHWSTDYVFSGGGGRLLRSGGRTKPQGTYGRTKLEGERAACRAVLGSAARLLVVRAGWLFSETRAEGFPARVLEQALLGRLKRMRTNQYGRPTSYEALAAWSARMLLAGTLEDIAPGEARTLHFAPAGPVVSRFVLTRRVLTRAAGSPLLAGEARERLERTLESLTGLRTHVRSQPENCRLAGEQADFFGTASPPAWPPAVDRCVDVFLRRRCGGAQA